MMDYASRTRLELIAVSNPHVYAVLSAMRVRQDGALCFADERDWIAPLVELVEKLAEDNARLIKLATDLINRMPGSAVYVDRVAKDAAAVKEAPP